MESRRLGMVMGTVGFLILAVNFVDFLAGWNRVADLSAILGAALTLIGAYLVMRSVPQV